MTLECGWCKRGSAGVGSTRDFLMSARLERTQPRGDFFEPAFVTAACPERFDECVAFARFLAAGVRDLVLAGDLRAGFLTMVILVIR